MADLIVANAEVVEIKDNYGKFKAEPLEVGFGITLGNALRRTLLSYLPGAAVTQVRIEGILHEFTVIPGVKEDVIEFLLNVKALRLKSITGQSGKLVLEANGEKEVLASDITPSSDFEIINQDQHLATLTSRNAKLNVEFDVEIGTGYKTAQSTENMQVGAIPVDGIFTPVHKVNFFVEPLHIGQQTSRERLVLEIWTDGSIQPGDALSLASNIIIQQLTPIANFTKAEEAKAEVDLVRLSIPDEKYNMPVDQLDLSVRTMNCLRRSGITTVGQLLGKGPKELLKLRNFGQKSFQEIEERLAVIDLHFPQDERDIQEITESGTTDNQDEDTKDDEDSNSENQ